MNADVTLVLMAGGKGTRLGRVPKGLVQREGRPVLEWQLQALGPLCADVLLVTNEPQAYAAFGLRSVADARPDRGPLGGLVTAMDHARTARVLCVACDLPFVTAEAAQPLLDAREGVDAVLYSTRGRLEPMLAVYATNLRAAFSARLEAPPSFAELLEGLRTTVLPAEGRLEERVLANVNEPADLERLGLELPG